MSIESSKNSMSDDTQMVLLEKGEKPRFINLCTFSKPVYAAYLRGMESKAKTVLFVSLIIICVLVMAFGFAASMRLDIVGAGLLGCVVGGLALAQPWMMARSKIAKNDQRYGEFQRNKTKFYENCMVMENLSAHVEAVAQYSEIKRIKATEDFIYLFVNKYCYFALTTGFTRGEDEIEPFKEFIKERAVNAKGRL